MALTGHAVASTKAYHVAKAISDAKDVYDKGKQVADWLEEVSKDEGATKLVDTIIEEHGSDGLTCPLGGAATCGKTFKNIRGLHTHLGKMHGADWRDQVSRAQLE